MDEDDEIQLSPPDPSTVYAVMDVINCLTELPTLQHTAVIYAAIKFWTEVDMMNYMKENLHQPSHLQCTKQLSATTRKHFKTLIVKVKKKVTVSFLSQSLKVEVLRVIGSIGWHLLKFVFENISEYCLLQYIFENGGKIRWTMRGMIDKAAIMKDMIRMKDSWENKCSLFKLACKYCSEEHIFDLREHVDSCDILHRESFSYDNLMVVYWASSHANDMSSVLNFFEKSPIYIDRDTSIHCHMFKESRLAQNIWAMNYFWPKLTNKEKNGRLEDAFMWSNQFNECDNYYEVADILFFYLSHLNSQNFKDFFESDLFCSLYYILSNLIDIICHTWPIKDNFLMAFKVLLECDPQQNHFCALTYLATQFKKDSSVEKLFLELWFHSPKEVKTSFISYIEEEALKMMYKLLKLGSHDTLDLILKETSPADKSQVALLMIETQSGLIFDYFISSNKLNLLDIILTKTLQSNHNITSWKQRLLNENGYELLRKLFQDDKFHEATKLLNWGFDTHDQIRHFKKSEINCVEVCRNLLRNRKIAIIYRFLKWYIDYEDKKHQLKVIGDKNIFIIVSFQLVLVGIIALYFLFVY